MGSELLAKKTDVAPFIRTLNIDLWADLKVGGRSFFILSILIAVLAWKLAFRALVSDVIVQILSQHSSYSLFHLTFVRAR